MNIKKVFSNNVSQIYAIMEKDIKLKLRYKMNLLLSYFTPIINYPDSAILGVGKIYEKPVVYKGQIVARPVMSLNLTFDHRVADGATGARFISHVKERLEDPHLLFLDID